MSREQSLRNGAGLMVFGALIFLVYAVVFFFRAFASSGFEIGVETLNGVTPQQLDKLNPAIMGYITHLHVAVAGFIAAPAIAAGGDEPCYGHVQVRDVAHDCRVKLIELLRRNAVQRLNTDLESNTREGPKKEHDGVHEEYQSPKHHEACAIAQGLLSGHCFLLGLDDTVLDDHG